MRVVVVSVGSAVVDAKGLGYRGLAAINPALVMASITGFGQTGAKKSLHCNDLVALADLLPDADPLKPSFEELSAITPWATAFRYPSDDPVTEAKIAAMEVEQRLVQIEAVLRRLSAGLGA